MSLCDRCLRLSPKMSLGFFFLFFSLLTTKSSFFPFEGSCVCASSSLAMAGDGFSDVIALAQACEENGVVFADRFTFEVTPRGTGFKATLSDFGYPRQDTAIFTVDAPGSNRNEAKEKAARTMLDHLYESEQFQKLPESYEDKEVRKKQTPAWSQVPARSQGSASKSSSRAAPTMAQGNTVSSSSSWSNPVFAGPATTSVDAEPPAAAENASAAGNPAVSDAFFLQGLFEAGLYFSDENTQFIRGALTKHGRGFEEATADMMVTGFSTTLDIESSTTIYTAIITRSDPEVEFNVSASTQQGVVDNITIILVGLIAFAACRSPSKASASSLPPKTATASATSTAPTQRKQFSAPSTQQQALQSQRQPHNSEPIEFPCGLTRRRQMEIVMELTNSPLCSPMNLLQASIIICM